MREALGMSSDELARRVRTSGATIRRLETGTRALSQPWMEKISEVLGCSPADLISNAALSEAVDEVELVDTFDGYDSVRTAIATMGLRAYRVTEQGKALVQAGISPGDVITVNHS